MVDVAQKGFAGLGPHSTKGETSRAKNDRLTGFLLVSASTEANIFGAKGVIWFQPLQCRTGNQQSQIRKLLAGVSQLGSKDVVVDVAQKGFSGLGPYSTKGETSRAKHDRLTGFLLVSASLEAKVLW